MKQGKGRGNVQLSTAVLTKSSAGEGGGEVPLWPRGGGGREQWPRITGIGALRGSPEALPNQPGSVQILTIPDTAT